VKYQQCQKYKKSINQQYPILHNQKYKRRYELPTCQLFTTGSTKIMANYQSKSSSQLELQNCILTTTQLPLYQHYKWNCEILRFHFFIIINTKETETSTRQFVFWTAVNNSHSLKMAQMRTQRPQLLMTYV
jgi:hypothetical protein